MPLSEMVSHRNARNALSLPGGASGWAGMLNYYHWQAA
jgi:hypothetical protein